MEKAAITRFQMTKNRHHSTLDQAARENKLDPQLQDICQWFQEAEHYFTSSGCSGRIVLLDMEKENSKLNAYLHRKWHRTVETGEVLEGIREPTKGEVWLKLDPFILHVGCQTLAHAEDVLKLMNKAGIKRGGIFSVKDGRYLVELLGSHVLSMPVKDKAQVLVSEEYLSYVVKRMNEKLGMNYDKLLQLEKVIKEQLEP